METARVASLRGHDVTLVEKSAMLGGAMLMASVPNEKMWPQLKYKIREIKKLPIEVRLKTEATPALVDEIKPDVVVVAVGGKTRLPEVPGVDKPSVRGRSVMEQMFGGGKSNNGKKKDFWVKLALPFLSMVNKVYYNPNIVRKLLKYDFVFFRKQNAILGGGFAGLEMAELLTNSGKKVSALIEEGEHIGANIGPIHRWVFKKALRDHNVPLLKQAKVLEITDDAVEVEVEANRQSVGANTVVPTEIDRNTALYDQIRDKVQDVHLIGDANKAGMLMEAYAAGFLTGNAI